MTATPPTRRRPWPKLPPRLVADLLAGHSAIGLAFGALIYLICLTGTIAVFVDEMKLAEAPGAAVETIQLGALNRAVDAAVTLAGGPTKAPYVFVTGPVTPRQRWTVLAGGETWRMDAAGGLAPVRTPFTDFVTGLHMTLLLPGPWGAAIVGVVGVALLSLIVSGVLAHPRILRDAFVLRLGGARRLQEADLHNRLSVWGLPFHLAVSLSGAFFGLSYLMLLVVAGLGFHGDIARAGRVLQVGAVASDLRPSRTPLLDPLVAQARRLQPGSVLSYVEVERPGTRGARLSIEVTAPGRLPRGEQAIFDASGKLVGRGRFASGDLGLQAYSGAAQV
ncbi:MAG: PepSY-associated TM helix domain-containing protein, partial [Caulobacteraceae bacterium]